MLYNLMGTADTPKSMGKINREIDCRQKHIECIPIFNWLNKPQRFKVQREILKPDKIDSNTFVSGLDYIDVPGDLKKDYKLSILTYREGSTLIRVNNLKMYTFLKCFQNNLVQN